MSLVQDLVNECFDWAERYGAVVTENMKLRREMTTTDKPLTCPYCGSANTFPCFHENVCINGFQCDDCAEGWWESDPVIERIRALERQLEEARAEKDKWHRMLARAWNALGFNTLESTAETTIEGEIQSLRARLAALETDAAYERVIKRLEELESAPPEDA